MAPSTRCYPMDFVLGITELRLPRKYINISLILQPGVVQRKLVTDKNYASKSKCMQIYHIIWVYVVFQPSESYLSYKREIWIYKPLPWRLRSVYTRVLRQVHVDRQIHPEIE